MVTDEADPPQVSTLVLVLSTAPDWTSVTKLGRFGSIRLRLIWEASVLLRSLVWSGPGLVLGPLRIHPSWLQAAWLLDT